MSDEKPKTSQSTPDQPNNSGGDSSIDLSRRRRWITVAVVAAVVVVLIAAVAVYLDQVLPFRTTVVQVDNEGVSMRTFLRRLRYSGEEPYVMLQTLSRELLVKIEAPQSPYNVEVTDDELDAFLRRIAAGVSGSMEEAAYKEWFRQQVNESQMPEGEFRELIRNRLLMDEFEQRLAEQVPTVAEQVRLLMFPVNGLEAAEAAKQRIESGEDFGDVAGELSVDPQNRAARGDMGWQARSGLIPSIATVVFDTLTPGEVSDPFYIDGDMFALITIPEPPAARELSQDARSRIQARALDEWFVEAAARHEITFSGITGGGYSSDTDAWVKWQLQRMD